MDATTIRKQFKAELENDKQLRETITLTQALAIHSALARALEKVAHDEESADASYFDDLFYLAKGCKAFEESDDVYDRYDIAAEIVIPSAIQMLKDNGYEGFESE